MVSRFVCRRRDGAGLRVSHQWKSSAAVRGAARLVLAWAPASAFLYTSNQESDSILLTFEAFSVTSLPDEPQRAATLPRPRTASANFASRGQLLMDSGKQRMQLKQNFDKTLVRIFYDSELLTNAWLQDFVAGWLAQKKLAQEAKKDRR